MSSISSYDRPISVDGISVIVSLTSDAGFDYNDQFFTLEISDPSEDENDAEISPIKTTASRPEITEYLSKVSDSVFRSMRMNGLSVKNLASQVVCQGLTISEPSVRTSHKFKVSKNGGYSYWYSLMGGTFTCFERTPSAEATQLRKLMQVMVDFEIDSVSVGELTISKKY